MAKDKKSVLLYCDLIHTVEKLSDQNAGLLIKHFLRYVNDINPTPPNDLIDLVFEPIKQQLKRDLKEWEKTKEGYSKGGKASAEKRSRLKQVEDSSSKSTVNVTVTDTVTDTVKVNDITKKSVLEIWFSDLENSTLLERIAMDYKLTVPKVKLMLIDFKPKLDVSYKTYNDLANHFKNWVPKNLPKQTTKRTPLV